MTVLFVGGLRVFRRDGVTVPELAPASIHGAAWINLQQQVSDAVATGLPCGVQRQSEESADVDCRRGGTDVLSHD